MNKAGFSLVEVVVSVIILSIFLVGAYSAMNNFYTIIHYIDSNVNGLNMTKSTIDEILNLRNTYFSDYPIDGWGMFAEKYSSGTFRYHCTGNEDQLCKINDNRNEYEGPLDSFGNPTTDTNGIYYFRKVDIQEANTFYLKNIDRINTGTGEILNLKFTQSILNQRSFIISGDFDNTNLEISTNLPIDFYNINGKSSSNGEFSNLSNNNVRYSKIVSYENTTISPTSYFSLHYSGGLLIKKIEFYDGTLPTPATGLIPLKIESSTDENYSRLCDEIDSIEGLSCEFHYFTPSNFYKKLVGIDRELSNIDFGENFHFTFSGSNNNELWIYLSGNVLPTENNFLYLNPYYKIMYNKNSAKPFDVLSMVSDSTAGKGVLIPNKPFLVGGINTSTGYTSLINLSVTTYLYDNNTYIDAFKIDTKLGDINRYQDYYENE